MPGARIDGYSFGRIDIAGYTYASDVIILPDRVVAPWRRRRGHELTLDDLAVIITPPPAALIIGTGANGMMKVPIGVADELGKRFAGVITVKTGEAVRIYNGWAEDVTVVAALHLTC